jgi:hypothetical protein
MWNGCVWIYVEWLDGNGEDRTCGMTVCGYMRNVEYLKKNELSEVIEEMMW